MAKRKVNKNRGKIDKKVLLISAAIAVVLLVLFVPTLFVQQPQPYIPVGQKGNYKVASEGNGCITNVDCFLVNCKSKPSVVECVNATAMDLYYVNCNNSNSNVDVNPVQNFTSCACDQGTCRMISK